MLYRSEVEIAMKDFVQRKFVKHYLAILLLFSMTAVSFFIFVHSKNIYASSDFLFHWNRINFLTESLRHFQLNYRSFNLFGQIGSAVNFFYPFESLIPFSVFQILVNNTVVAFYLGMHFYIFLTLLVAYFSFYAYRKSVFSALMFATLYGFASYHFAVSFNAFVMGEFLAYTFLPLVALGFYRIFFSENPNIWSLVIGITLVIYSHILSTVIVVFLLGIAFLFTLITKKMSKFRFLALMRAVLVVVALTSVVWAPFLYELSQTRINSTIVTNVLYMQTVLSSVKESLLLGHHQYFVIGITGLVSIALALTRWHVKEVRYALMAGMTMFIVSTANFGWQEFPLAIQSLIQFPYRFTPYAMLFLSFAAAETSANWSNNFVILGLKWGMVFAPFVFWIVLASSHIGMKENDPNIQFPARNRPFPAKFLSYETEFKIDKEHAKDIFDRRQDFIGIRDYGPINSWRDGAAESIAAHVVSVNGQPYNSVVSRFPYNQAVFDFTQGVNGEVDIPILRYGNEVVEVDGKKIKTFTSSRGTIALDSRKSIKRVTVSYATPLWIYFDFAAILVIWIVLLFNFIHTILRRRTYPTGEKKTR
jgi:hypothetical protein